MALYKDEIYVTWDAKASNIINHLLEVFSSGHNSHKLDIHVFLHQTRWLDQKILEWPENFSFHFTATPTQNALQTAMIAFVLEKFERVSGELALEDITKRSNVFFIQGSNSQFEELKSMLYRIPHIKNSFTFKLLSMTDDLNTDMLFQLSNDNKRRPPIEDSGRFSEHFNETFDLNGTLSPRSVRFGRRSDASDDMFGRSNKISRANSDRENLCQHCERQRGSQPRFGTMDKQFFCMACFLEERATSKSNCKNCQRTKHVTTEDKGIMTYSLIYCDQTDVGVQCSAPVHECEDACVETTPFETSTVACQTDISLLNTSESLEKQLNEVLEKIRLEQQDEKQVENVKMSLPVMVLPESGDPFRLGDIEMHPTTNKYHCPFCDNKSFAKISIFEVHLRNTHKKCNCSCERYFPTLEDYLQHFYSVFPLPCFEQRKCPERFRSLPYQAIHHAKVHFAEKPYYCVVCFDSYGNSNNANNNTTKNGKRKKVFKNIRSLQIHCQEMGHTEEELFLRVKNTDENNEIPLTGRASAINFSGKF